ncbi:hypothetical protein HOY82DRAFT_590302 [Tuber indicum]|nr:hypothetical protein HOY82DRAFT_590302 [Tuber indicum]
MLRKAIFHLGFCIALAIGSPFCSHRTDPGPEPTCASIISAPPLPTTSLQSSNAIYDEKPCVAIKIIHGVTIESPCRYRIRAKRGIPPTPSENTPTLLDDVTTFYVYVTEAITSSSPRSSFSATTLVPTSTTPKATATLVSSLLLHINSPAGATKTSLAQSHGTPPGTLQSSAHISLSTTSISSNPTSKNTISTSISSHSQSPTTRLSPPKPTFGISDVPTGASTIPSPTLPPTHGLTSIMHEPSAMPVATHSPILPMGVDQISSVITDISLLLSVLAETQASATSLMGSGQTLNTHTLLTSPSVTTHVSSVTPAPLPALGMVGISSVITDITLLESILAATLTSVLTPASTQTMTKASMAASSSYTLAPLGSSGNKSITSTRTIIRTASPPNATGGKKPVRVDKPLWSAGETAVECTCQCRGRRFTITATKSV